MRVILVVVAWCAACGTAARSSGPVTSSAAGDPLKARCRTHIDACIALSERSPAPAPQALQESCDRGDVDACFELALAVADGRSVAQDPARALALQELACRGGHPIACGMAGNARLTGQGSAVDFRAAFQLFGRGCDANEPVSCDMLGQMHEKGHGTAQDPAAARRLFERACGLDGGAGCFDQARMIMRADTEGTQLAAVCKLIDTGCRLGEDAACDELANTCEEVFPVAARNRTEFRRRAQLCHDGGTRCGEAGALLEGAPGVPADPRQADRMYARGCEANDVDSCVRRAKLQARGTVAGDPRKTLGEACSRAVPGACLTAGRDYRAGELIGRDPARALDSFTQACAQGEPEGCSELARGQRDGLAGRPNPTAAAASFVDACERGPVAACHEGLRLPALAPEARARLAADACFRGDDATCADVPLAPGLPGHTLTPIQIPLTWPDINERVLSFVGANGHALFASSGDSVALLDPAGRVAAAWRVLASPRKPGPRFDDPKLSRGFGRAMWRWDAAAGSVHAVGAAGGFGVVDYGVATWSPASGRLPVVVQRPTHNGVAAIAWSPERQLVVMENEGDVVGAYLFDLATRRQIGPAFDNGLAMSAAFTADGARAAVGTEAGKIALFTADGGALAWLDNGPTRVRSLAFHPSRPVLASVDAKHRVRIWEVGAADRAPRVLPDVAELVAFSPDGRFLVLGSGEELVLLDATTFSRVARPVRLRGAYLHSVVFSPDGRYLAVASNDDGVDVVDLAPGAATTSVDPAWFVKLRRLPTPEPPPAPVFGRAGVISGVVTMGGAPVAGAEIELRPAPREWPDARAVRPRSTRCDSGGKFALDKLPEVVWWMSIVAPESAVAYKEVDLRDPHVMVVAVDLPAGLTREASVVDAAGKPVAGVRITDANGAARATSDRAGKFAVRHLPYNQSIALRALAPGGAVAAGWLAVEGEQPLVLHLVAPNDPRVLRLRVVDPAGKPIAGAQVFVGGVSVSEPGSTDADGRFLVISPTPTLEVSVTQQPFQPVYRTLSMPQRGVMTIALKLPQEPDQR